MSNGIEKLRKMSDLYGLGPESFASRFTVAGFIRELPMLHGGDLYRQINTVYNRPRNLAAIPLWCGLTRTAASMPASATEAGSERRSANSASTNTPTLW